MAPRNPKFYIDDVPKSPKGMDRKLVPIDPANIPRESAIPKQIVRPATPELKPIDPANMPKKAKKVKSTKFDMGVKPSSSLPRSVTERESKAQLKLALEKKLKGKSAIPSQAATKATRKANLKQKGLSPTQKKFAAQAKKMKSMQSTIDKLNKAKPGKLIKRGAAPKPGSSLLKTLTRLLGGRGTAGAVAGGLAAGTGAAVLGDMMFPASASAEAYLGRDYDPSAAYPAHDVRVPIDRGVGTQSTHAGYAPPIPGYDIGLTRREPLGIQNIDPNNYLATHAQTGVPMIQGRPISDERVPYYQIGPAQRRFRK